jgi:hypothetical protein
MMDNISLCSFMSFFFGGGGGGGFLPLAYMSKLLQACHQLPAIGKQKECLGHSAVGEGLSFERIVVSRKNRNIQ